MAIAVAAGMPLTPPPGSNSPSDPLVPGGLSRPSLSLVTKKGAFKPPQPGEVFLTAALHSTERRINVDRIRSARASGSSAAAQQRLSLPVAPGPFVGTVVNAASGTALGDEEFDYFMGNEEIGTGHAKRTIELLKRAHEIFKAQKQAHGLIRSRALMAAEYLVLGEVQHARNLLQAAATVRGRRVDL